jgi:hypothetical protein
VIEAIAYGRQIFPSALSSWRGIPMFLAAHSSLDTGAEWIIALGCVLTLHRTIQMELTKANDDLRSAQKVLQDLVVTRADRAAQSPRAACRIAGRILEARRFFRSQRLQEHQRCVWPSGRDDCLQDSHARTISARRSVIRYAGDEFVVTGARSPNRCCRISTALPAAAFERGSGGGVRGQPYLAPGRSEARCARRHRKYDAKAGQRGGGDRAAAVDRQSRCANCAASPTESTIVP